MHPEALEDQTMASRKTAGKTQSKAATTHGDAMEQKVVALAEQLGWFLGTVRGKADGWLDNPTVRTEVARIRDGAAELMEQVTRASASAKQAVATAGTAARKAVKTAKASTPVVVSVAKPSRGSVDAPGKRHRKPPPQERVDKRMGEPEGKHMGRKQFQPGVGGRRG